MPRDAGLEIQRLSPLRVASLPSSVMAHLAMIHGRPWASSFRYGAFSARASLSSSPTCTSMPARFELGDSLSRDFRERIALGDNHAAHAGADQCLRTRRSLAVMATGLERDVYVGAARARGGDRQGLDLGVRTAEARVEAFANDLAVAHDRRSPPWDWARPRPRRAARARLRGPCAMLRIRVAAWRG